MDATSAGNAGRAKPYYAQARIETPDQALIRVDRDNHELVEAEDWNAVTDKWSAGTLKLAAIRWCQRDHRRVLSPEPPKPRQQASGEAGMYALLWLAVRALTREQGLQLAGRLKDVFTPLKRGQRLDEAMTQEQFVERFAGRQ